MYNRNKIQACLPRYQQQLQLAQALNNAEMVTESIQDLFNCSLHLQNPQACQQTLQTYVQRSMAMGLAESTRQSMTGRFAWLNGDYASAVQAFSAALAENDLNQDYYHYWLGKAHLYQGDLDAATDCLNKALEHHRTHKNAVEMAKVYSQLALLALKRGKTRQAVQHLSTSLKTQQAHGVETSPEEAQIQQAIRDQLEREGVKLYESLTAQARAIDLKPDFLLPELAQTHTGQDGKPMLLIPAGPVFIGKGEIETPTTEQLLDNIEQYLYPYRQHSGDYLLPPHPDSVFDEDQLLFLLEQSSSLPAEEKQQFLDKIPAMPEKDIQQLINKLDREYQAANPKATEIYLYPYYIDREPVSNAEYQAFCTDTEHSCPAHWLDNKIPDKAADLPVVNISLEDAKAYAQWAGKEIPTAPEWEKACRGEQGILYPWGNEWDESRVKAKDGAIRKQFEAEYLELNPSNILRQGSGITIKEEAIPKQIEAEYLELNATIPEQGGLVHFKTPCFTLPPHQLELDEAEFLSYLQGALSLTADDKHKIVKTLPGLTQAQVDELLRILREEKTKFLELGKEHEATLNPMRKQCYIELMHKELLESDAELGTEIPEKGGMVQFKMPRFTLPPHELALDEEEFLNYLQGSVSLTADEKCRIVAALPRLTQAQIDELLRILREEKEKFLALDKQHEPQLNQLRKKHYVDLMEPELAELCLNALHEPAQNESPCGIRDLAGSIYQMTVSESGGAFLIKGGSWFSENPREACQAWAAETINARDKRMDAGFRCVKPIFSKEDLQDNKRSQ
ncbi:MAG: SUMF1/EgtB/PvdO family nonheme iron enzyme [Gammaproteobacteria bacterium]|nr:SUMF1/EgtB/PvdO family nonheme iron enzyme [Gammaproteobacteria bacterium]